MTHADRVFVRVNINLMQKQRNIQMYVDLWVFSRARRPHISMYACVWELFTY